MDEAKFKGKVSNNDNSTSGMRYNIPGHPESKIRLCIIVLFIIDKKSKDLT